jgi:hypothetical protein
MGRNACPAKKVVRVLKALTLARTQEGEDMGEDDVSELDFQLKKLFTQNMELFEYHRWPWEHMRWVELVFALVSVLSSKPRDVVREAVETLDDLELLDINDLSEIPLVSGDIGPDFPLARRINEILSEHEFTSEESKNAILAMTEAAKSLMEHHGGKIQRYLRHYGVQMLEDLPQTFPLSKMDQEHIRFAFTFWIQNVLNMPVDLPLKSVAEFCEKYKASQDELLETADKLDVNLALLDDLIEEYAEDLKKKQQSQDQ